MGGPGCRAAESVGASAIKNWVEQVQRQGGTQLEERYTDLRLCAVTLEWKDGPWVPGSEWGRSDQDGVGTQCQLLQWACQSNPAT